MINDIIAAARELLEPDPTEVVKDEAAAQPLEWQPGTLYLYPLRNADVPFETGPSSRQDFGLMAVFVADAHEEAAKERSAEVSAQLDAKRAAYVAAVIANRRTTAWHHIQATESRTPPRTLQGRGIALELTGYRLV